MFYLKYRPKTINELDNSQIREKITKLLNTKDIPHALLFVGPKGVGKTSTARIFAKSINCSENIFSNKNKSIEPCNNCANCLSVDSDSSPDVVEQDAASNRGIEEIRKLIRDVSYTPMTGKYRVYIIDEAHMITPDAFNALLKTLEEPPKTAIFILATTNEEKLPITIISRCIRFSFGNANIEDITGMLKKITRLEKISVADDLLSIIAKNCENSFRDATKLLEELVVQDMLSVELAQKYLGIRSKGKLLDVIEKSTLSKSILWIEDFVADGGNTKRLIEETLRSLKEQLVAKSTGVTTVPDYNFSLKEISILIKLFHEAYENVKFSPILELPLELVVVQFYNSRISTAK